MPTHGLAQVHPARPTGGQWTPVVGEETNTLLGRLGIRDDKDRKTLLSEAVEILARCNDPCAPSAPATGLAIGQIQSGKTSSFTVVAALARDNRYAMVIVIAGTSLPLFRQSDSRLIQDLRLNERPDRAWMRLANPTKDDSQRVRGPLLDWKEGHKSQTVLLTVMKNHKHLQHLAELLSRLDMGAFPTLIIDDEADQASLNSKVRRSQQSTTYRRLLEVRATLPNHTLLQYTATPQAPLLISLIDALSPGFARVLTPGKGYTGGKRFFLGKSSLAEDIPDQELPIPANNLIEPPASLLRAMRLFFLGVAADYLVARGSTPDGNRSMLVHPSIGVIPHAEYARWVNSTKTVWHQILQADPYDVDRKELLSDFALAHSDLSKTVSNLAPLSELALFLPKAIDRTVVTVMNATGIRGTPEVHFREVYPHILIGGQALDRGFTVEGLTITYMPRSVGVGNVDTVQQRARFYGYKSSYIGYCRVFLERNVTHAYRTYIEHEESLQKQIRTHGDRPLMEWKRAFLLDSAYSPTRRNILGFDYVKDDYSDKWFLPGSPHRNPDAVSANVQLVSDFVQSVKGWSKDNGEPDRTPEQVHLVARVSASQAMAGLLAPLRIVDPWDSMTFTGVLLQVATWLEDHAEATAAVYQMSGGRQRRRSIDPDKDEIKNLHQGKNPKSGRIIYPGDAQIRDSGSLSVQIHTLNVDGVVAPAIAVWVPSAMSKGWLSATMP